MQIEIGEIYRHFKGNQYEVKAIATHSETGEKMVVYQALYGDNEMFVRPYDSFISMVDRDKYPDVQQDYRFEEEKANESLDIDPMVLKFLQTEDWEEKYTIVCGMQHRITKDQINVMAMSFDMTIEDGELVDMYRQLRTCVDTRRRFETTRLR